MANRTLYFTDKDARTFDAARKLALRRSLGERGVSRVVLSLLKQWMESEDTTYPADDDPLATTVIVKCGTFTPEAQKPQDTIRISKDLYHSLQDKAKRAEELDLAARSTGSDADRFDTLYEIATVTRDGKISIEIPLDPKARFDGTSALWDRMIFRASVDAICAEPAPAQGQEVRDAE